MIYCCENCRFLFMRDFCDCRCPDCGKLTVRLANDAEIAEYKRIQIVNQNDNW